MHCTKYIIIPINLLLQNNVFVVVIDKLTVENEMLPCAKGGENQLIAGKSIEIQDFFRKQILHRILFASVKMLIKIVRSTTITIASDEVH